jgi:hypothetical protein
MHPDLVERDMHGLHNHNTWFKDAPDLIFSNQISNITNNKSFLNNIGSPGGINSQLQISQQGLVEWKIKCSRNSRAVSPPRGGIREVEYNLVCHLDKRITRDELDKIIIFFENIDLKEYGILDGAELRKISILLKSQLN